MRSLKLVRSLRTAPVLLLLAARLSAADPVVVDEVVVEGTRTNHPDVIRFLLQTRAGQRFDPQKINDDVLAIERMGPFTGTRAHLVYGEGAKAGKVTVVFRVTEVPRVATVEFDGLGYFQRSKVEKSVVTKPNGWLNPAQLEADRNAIERFLRESGYREARVDVDQRVEDGLAYVTFRTDLGREVLVGRTIWPGLPQELLPRDLDAVIVNRPGSPWQADLLSVDHGAVRQTLQDLGWLNAQVAEPVVDRYDLVLPTEERRRHGPRFAPDGAREDRVMMTMRIDAGGRWKLGKVRFVGNTVASEEELRKAFALPEGAWFRRADIERALKDVRRVIANQGYARANASFETTDKIPDPETRTMDLTVHVFEGDIYTVDRIDVNGNQRTRDAIIRRAMRILPGQLWNEDAIDESRRQILRTGMYKGPPQAPRLTPEFDEDRPGHVDLFVDVSEDSTAQLRFQLGYSSAFGVFGEIGFKERNFNILGPFTGEGLRGAGQEFEISGYASEERTSFSVSWGNPHLFDGPYTLSTALSRSDSRVRDWDELRLTASASIGRKFLNNDLEFSLGYSYTDLQVSDVEDDAADDALDGEGDYYLNTILANQSYDRLDNRRLPTRGYRLAATESLSGGITSASAELFEYSLKGDVFVPFYTARLGGVTFLRLSERWRETQGIGDTEAVPFYERYFGGGPSPKHRGFDNNRLTPYAINRNGFRSRVGGVVDQLFTAELIVPLQGTNEGLRLAVFSDIGNVWGDGESLSLNDLRSAVGFGIRFPIQLPVALDFAWLLDAERDESDSQIHFSLGFFAF